MKKQILTLSVLFLQILFSCSTGIDKQLINNWKVIKMKKIVKVMSNSYTPIDIAIHKNMSYQFLSNEKVKLVTQSGTKLNRLWSIKDSIITINIEGELKEFTIIKLTDKNLIMISDNFKFHMEK